MPITAKINNAIPSQNGELIRDQIGAILLVEFSNQAANWNLPANCTPTNVQVEGFVPVDSEIFPMVFVRLVSAEEMQKDSSGDAVYEYCYYIDLFTGDASTDTTMGDVEGTLALQKMIGIIRAILEDPRYDLLGFPNTQINIWNTHIDNWYINLPKNNGDTDDSICGRVEFKVTCTEVPSSYVGTHAINWVDANVQILHTDKGYYWKMLQQEISITVTGATLTNSFFVNQIDKIMIGGATYTLNTDFTQAGTTITATTFTFTNLTTILARTS